MNWISVKDRVPDDRREVHVWGFRAGIPFRPLKGKYLGTTKFNRVTHGGSFDIEATRYSMLPCVLKVTHWAEIQGPTQP